MTTLIDPGALRLARAAVAKLNVHEKAVLLSELAQAVAAAATPPTEAAPATVGRTRGFSQLRDVAAAIHAAYPNADVGARLDADRRERDPAVPGEVRDVYP